VKYTFGRISVDASARTIAAAGQPVHLTRKAFDLLLLLLEHRGTAVSKDSIYARLWPDTFVAESSLQTLVHEIRQAIDDRETSPSWIRTVHGVGYSFAGDVHATPVASASARSERPAAWLFRESMRLPLYVGENVLGRGVEDVIEVDLPTISRRHARITIGEPAMLEDLSSKNGTWLRNERVIEPARLADGDEVRLGSAAFTFRLARSPKSTESSEMTAPPTNTRKNSGRSQDARRA
jgi:DNA-binding winged helix-turn-helix (wHTH) protein